MDGERSAANGAATRQLARKPGRCEHAFVSFVVCVLLPRFELVVAAGGREALLRHPAVLAPEPGREQLVGEVSAAAEAFGIHLGMRMGEALARCPRLALVPPDPLGVADAWERVLARLEGIGAAVEPGRPGLACFDARGLRRLHGGSVDGVLAAAREALRRRPATATATGPGRPAAGRATAAIRLGVGPSRFCAVVAAAARARARRPGFVAGAADLAAEPVALLRHRSEVADLPVELERLGIGTLGALAALPRAAVADRFGRPGLLAHDLAHGRDTPLRPRRPGEVLEEVLELEESSSGTQLERALGLLVDRLLARRERDGRTLRAVVLGAALVEGGTWRERVVFREPLADAGRMRLVLVQRLGLLPAPAEALRLSVERFGPPHPAGAALFDDGSARRAARLREAIRQVRAAAGPEAALRILAVDPDSRVPERRAVLTPFEL
ncbi:MAG: protein ImuB [Solirubrobacteraceae bacterium]|jgi:protein ImuB|nr:protein ImuB [Solirubrobacteraceae bacterium]